MLVSINPLETRQQFNTRIVNLLLAKETILLLNYDVIKFFESMSIHPKLHFKICSSTRLNFSQLSIIH